MDIFEKMTVTSIEMAVNSVLSRGEEMTINNRRWYGLTFAADGCNVFTQNGKEYISDSRHALVLPKNATYSIYCREEGHFPVINFFVSKPIDVENIVSIEIPGSAYFVSRCEKLRRLTVIGDTASRAKSLAVVYDIISQLARMDSLADYSPVLYPAVRYLEKHYTDSDLSNKLLAEKAGISEVYFRKLFTASYGQTPGQYIQALRLSYAKELLSSGEKVADAAFKSGYGNPYHFCRLFKEKTGMTPSDYRRNSHITEF